MFQGFAQHISLSEHDLSLPWMALCDIAMVTLFTVAGLVGGCELIMGITMSGTSIDQKGRYRTMLYYYHCAHLENNKAHHSYRTIGYFSLVQIP